MEIKQPIKFILPEGFRRNSNTGGAGSLRVPVVIDHGFSDEGRKEVSSIDDEALEYARNITKKPEQVQQTARFITALNRSITDQSLLTELLGD